MILETAEVKTPLGVVVLFARAGKLCGLDFVNNRSRLQRDLTRRFGEFTTTPAKDPAGAATALAAYFAGRLEALDAVPVDTGGTEFQQRVWNALRAIPAGTTVSYARLAAKIGRRNAVRAVGTANGSNPVAIVIPCHRVIASNGGIGGYGGGIERKRLLLAHEADAKRVRGGAGREAATAR